LKLREKVMHGLQVQQTYHGLFHCLTILFCAPPHLTVEVHDQSFFLTVRITGRKNLSDKINVHSLCRQKREDNFIFLASFQTAIKCPLPPPTGYILCNS
jgi:hypothetical protein